MGMQWCMVHTAYSKLPRSFLIVGHCIKASSILYDNEHGLCSEVCWLVIAVMNDCALLLHKECLMLISSAALLMICGAVQAVCTLNCCKVSNQNSCMLYLLLHKGIHCDCGKFVMASDLLGDMPA